MTNTFFMYHDSKKKTILVKNDLLLSFEIMHTAQMSWKDFLTKAFR